MKIEDIQKEIEKAILNNAETTLVEFKDGRGGFPRTTVAKTLSAFGNSKSGGIIVFGIHEDLNKNLSIVGSDNIALLQEGMSQLVSNEMNIVLRLNYYVIEKDNKNILAVYVPECKSYEKPYHLKELGLPRGAYIREGNTDRQMLESEMKHHIRNAQGDDYDSIIIEELTIDDLSDEKIKYFLHKSAEKTQRSFDDTGNYIKTLENICVVGKIQEGVHPTLAGYLIFAKQKPQNLLRFERYVIRCVRYQGSGVYTDIIDSIDIGGTLDEQIDGMQNFILRNIRKSATIVGTKRVEKYEYPEKATREIVANAVIHRDYRITETYTQVNIFEDRIEVFNPGNLPHNITIENIRDSQMSRNKIMAHRLKDLDYLEEYGRGIDIVFSEMNKWKLLPPIFKNTSNSFKVILPGEKLSGLNDRQLKIWEYLVQNSRITRKSAEELLDVSQQTISNDLRQMRDINLIKQVGESTSTFYEPSF